MRHIAPFALAAAMAASFAASGVAQTTAPAPGGQQQGSDQPATSGKRPEASSSSGSGMGSSGSAGMGTKLEAGSNSFTENQVRSRLTDAGYTDISELSKDDQGIWRAKAKKGGQNVSVGFDYKGNIAPQ